WSSAAVHDQLTTSIGRSRRHAKSSRRIHHARLCIPSSPRTTRLPRPAVSRQEYPVAVVIRHPSPRICGDPAKAPSRIERPSAIHERVPSRANEVRLPAHSVPWSIEEIPVVSEVCRPVRIRRIALIGIARVTNVIVALLLVPAIERLFLNALRKRGLIVAREIKIARLVLLDRQHA